MRPALRLPLLAGFAGVLLSGCAGQGLSGCKDMAGPGWAPLGTAPADGRTLLSRTEFAGESGVIWLGRGDDHLMACVYGHGLTNPGCGGSQGVEFQKQNGQWQSKGVIMDVCHTPPDK
jgi:hypothetical protein